MRTDALATLIYTSGTTGRPKGVELTHDCWVYEAEGIDELRLLNEDDRQYFWLPLAHSFGKVLEAAQLRIGFSTAVDGRVEKIVENLGQVKPTFVAAVPRIFEKIYNKVVTGAKEAGGAKWAIFSWAFARRPRGLEPPPRRKGARGPPRPEAPGRPQARLRQAPRPLRRPPPLLRLRAARPLAKTARRVLPRGGHRHPRGVRPHGDERRQLREHARQAPLRDGRPAAPGDADPDRRGRRDPHPGPRRHARLPQPPRARRPRRSTRTAGSTRGDIGHVEDGFVKITDRKKDLIKTSGGKYVAPQMLERKLTVACPYVSHSLAHGDNRNFVSMLVALDPEAITKWAAAHGLAGKSYAEVAASKVAAPSSTTPPPASRRRPTTSRRCRRGSGGGIAGFRMASGPRCRSLGCAGRNSWGCAVGAGW